MGLTRIFILHEKLVGVCLKAKGCRLSTTPSLWHLIIKAAEQANYHRKTVSLKGIFASFGELYSQADNSVCKKEKEKWQL